MFIEQAVDIFTATADTVKDVPRVDEKTCKYNVYGFSEAEWGLMCKIHAVLKVWWVNNPFDFC